jgi:hypothetical protein
VRGVVGDGFGEGPGETVAGEGVGPDGAVRAAARVAGAAPARAPHCGVHRRHGVEQRVQVPSRIAPREEVLRFAPPNGSNAAHSGTALPPGRSPVTRSMRAGRRGGRRFGAVRCSQGDEGRSRFLEGPAPPGSRDGQHDLLGALAPWAPGGRRERVGGAGIHARARERRGNGRRPHGQPR